MFDQKAPLDAVQSILPLLVSLVSFAVIRAIYILVKLVIHMPNSTYSLIHLPLIRFSSTYLIHLFLNFNSNFLLCVLLQVFHSGIPLTLVPLDATNTIPINKDFFTAFQQHRSTYEAEYCFQMLNIIRDTWFDDSFYEVLIFQFCSVSFFSFVAR